jgi:hypothetical protein
LPAGSVRKAEEGSKGAWGVGGDHGRVVGVRVGLLC